MTTASSTFTVQVPVRRAQEAVPGKLTIGRATLDIADRATTEPYFGRQAQCFDATWRRRSVEGRARVEIRPSSKLTSEVVVTLDAPTGLAWKLFGTGQGLRSLAQLFGRALRYEVETRGVEQADGYAERRTTPELVRARSA